MTEAKKSEDGGIPEPNVLHIEMNQEMKVFAIKSATNSYTTMLSTTGGISLPYKDLAKSIKAAFDNE